MSSVAFILNVIFAVYLINFISAFINGFTVNSSTRAKVIIDIMFGILLFIAVIIFND